MKMFLGNRYVRMQTSLTVAVARDIAATDREKFKDLGWGLRTWDQWYFNECDDRFGDDWPGAILASKNFT